ncbi:Histone-lysine N-methyltransferase, H3 lysine-36 specific [Vanrija pseudolonga]|uniref:Histone-lysine N-methyltransferase, H3 lysine-36 specific n=1 Tax=Vanrija pseudolonga TaxID=143232 RepID=A0AAF0YAE8_9TREE|nr:Histone-lysine N-methyltransferase, H3 lysine-36 specific [Vanrija pseudolonga]
MSEIKDEIKDEAPSPADAARAVKLEAASSGSAASRERPPTPPLPESSRSGSPVKRSRSASPPEFRWGTESPEPERKPLPPLELDDEEDHKPGESSRQASSSAVSTPGGGGRGGRRRERTPPPPPRLIDDLPDAWDDAHATFEDLERCVYERKDLGLSREQDEMMVCDCVYDPACGPDSGCINRAIFIECLAGECRAGKHCQNQRVDIVQTEKKGFGLRAATFIPAGALIYEYIGEVVIEKTFRKRMADYAEEGIKHFYFMMLQKEEYIDATKKGGIGRFANHSCNPNCEVQKWVVGRRMRMGIFTKRDVLKGEEVTFNYNVDRYGHEAQICYCGEPNCVGFIGGKTQTDVGGIDDLFLDALGILDEVVAQGMKGSRKKKARQLDEDYVPVLHPMQENDVPKVAAAMRQSMENPRMMGRLLERVKMTDEPVVQRQLMRMHGFSLMTMILTDMADNRDIVLLALESMDRWKLTIRNKVEDSNIQEPVKILSEGSDAELAGIAKHLLEYWSGIELSYKIPRVHKIASLDTDDSLYTTIIAEPDAVTYPRHVAMDDLVNTATIRFEVAPVRRGPPPPIRHRPPPPPPPRAPPPSTAASNKSKLEAIIAMAQQSQFMTVSAPSSDKSPASAGWGSGRDVGESSEPRKRQKTSHRSAAEDEARKEKRLAKLVGEVVVRSMSKYKEQMEHETFKRYAKECTMILVDKEKRGHSYTAHRHPSLSEEKKAKIKAFTKEYAHKVLKKLKAKGKLKDPRKTESSSQTHWSPAKNDSTPSATPGKSASTPSGSLTQDTPRGGSQILDEMFGVDDNDDDYANGHGDGDDSMDVDSDRPITPAASSPMSTPASATFAPAKAVVVERASGPFLPSRAASGPIVLDRVDRVSLSGSQRQS